VRLPWAQRVSQDLVWQRLDQLVLALRVHCQELALQDRPESSVSPLALLGLLDRSQQAFPLLEELVLAGLLLAAPLLVRVVQMQEPHLPVPLLAWLLCTA